MLAIMAAHNKDVRDEIFDALNAAGKNPRLPSPLWGLLLASGPSGPCDTVPRIGWIS